MIAWSFFLCASHAHGGIAGGLLMPTHDLPEGLGHGVDDDGRFAAAKPFYGELGGLIGVFGGAPKANDDTVVREVRTDALADGAGLLEGEGG